MAAYDVLVEGSLQIIVPGRPKGSSGEPTPGLKPGVSGRLGLAPPKRTNTDLEGRFSYSAARRHRCFIDAPSKI